METGTSKKYSPSIIHLKRYYTQENPVVAFTGSGFIKYQGTTLREHIGAPEQYGLDPRV